MIKEPTTLNSTVSLLFRYLRYFSSLHPDLHLQLYSLNKEAGRRHGHRSGGEKGRRGGKKRKEKDIKQ